MHEAVSKGQEVIVKFKESCPEGFYNTISNPVVLMEGTKKSTKINGNPIYDQEFIWTRAMGLSASNRVFELEETLHTKMAPMPPAYFDDKGNMRSNTKSKLREAL